MSSEIKFRFAKCADERLVDVTSLRVEDKIECGKFYCIGCNEPMIARLGEQNTHHFAHKPNGVCSRETYLHKFGKSLFETEFKRCVANREPFYIEFKQRIGCDRQIGLSDSSCFYSKWVKLDLIQYLSQINAEKNEGAFRPDILLKSLDDKLHLFIEIAVTHKCSEPKRLSKNRIIEIKVEAEDDLECFRSHILSERNPKIQFWNLKLKRRVLENLCGWYRCRLDKWVFHIYEDLTWAITTSGRQPNQDKKVLWSNTFLHERRDDIHEYSVCMDFARDAWTKGIVLKTCFLCEHFDYWVDQKCVKFDESVECRKAFTCPHFTPLDSQDLTNIFNSANDI